MKIQVFALLKDHFEREFEITDHVPDIESLKNHLCAMQPSAYDVLQNCRFAVLDEFVDNHFQLTENDTICIIPPSSGG